MSQIVAAVAWGGGSIIATTQVESVLSRCPADSRAVRTTTAGVLGIARLAAEGSGGRGAGGGLHVDEVRGLAVVADCRLDNREALQRALGLDEATSDECLLLAAYQRWGEGFADQLLGDFACIVWDWARRRLVAARDHLGIKPLFYADVAGGVMVGSDVEILVRLARLRLEPDDQQILEHLIWNYQSVDRTFWRDVHRLPGGHVLVASSSGRRATRTWIPSGNFTDLRDARAVHERFRHLFFASVERRLGSAGPLVAHLSGGIDTSLILCTANQIYGDLPQPGPPLYAGAERYPGLDADEGPYIAAVASSVRFPLEEWDGRESRFEDLDAPALAGPGLRSHKNSGCAGDLELAARVGAKVILAGQGGDQLGSTAGVLDDRIAARKMGYLWDSVRRPNLSLAVRLDRLRRVGRIVAPRSVRRAAAARRLRAGVPDWLTPEWRERAVQVAERVYDPPPPTLRAHVQQAHWQELTGARLSLAIDLEQRCASVAGFEVRFPFLDRELVEFVLSIPPSLWPTPSGYGRLQRDALSALLPSLVVSRTKMKFAPVVIHRVQAALGRLSKLLEGNRWNLERFVSLDNARALLARFRSSPSDANVAQALWRIGTLEAWLRTFLGYHPSPEE
jgi:asparagine synthase (glutamine-hydrolysing)